MAIIVWMTLGIALWHFTVFLPDRFRGGIIGAFLAAVIGACISGALWQIASGDSLGETDIVTALAAIPGYVIANAITYMLGDRDEEARDLPY
jgi:hypothetical protein